MLQSKLIVLMNFTTTAEKSTRKLKRKEQCNSKREMNECMSEMNKNST